MSQKIWTSQVDKVTIANGGTNSDPFYVPDGAVSLTIFVPALTTGPAKIQVLTPKDGDQDSDTWTDLTILTQPAAAGALILVTTAALAQSAAYSMDAQVLGAGVFRFVSGSQTGAAVFRIAWNCIK